MIKNKSLIMILSHIIENSMDEKNRASRSYAMKKAYSINITEISLSQWYSGDDIISELHISDKSYYISEKQYNKIAVILLINYDFNESCQVWDKFENHKRTIQTLSRITFEVRNDEYIVKFNDLSTISNDKYNNKVAYENKLNDIIDNYIKLIDICGEINFDNAKYYNDNINYLNNILKQYA